MVASIVRPSSDAHEPRRDAATTEGLSDWVERVLSRRPAVGFAVSAIRDGEVVFHGAGLRDIARDEPITEGTLFRIGSVTKTITAIAVMQLCEDGLVDLDAPAQESLGDIRLVAAERGWRAPTIRHLLTHTSGIPDVLHVGDLLHPSWGPFESRPPLLSVRAGGSLPSLARYYRRGIEIVTEPGSAFAYSNHGFALLGQIVEEVSGQSLAEYFRRHIFVPLGMADTTLVSSDVTADRLARGYELTSSGPEPIADREWIGAGGRGVYSSTRDMVRYVQALLAGGGNDHGSVLDPSTMAAMFEFHHQPDPRLGGVGLGFFRHDVGGHRILGHDGILPGFNSSLLIAPDDGVGMVCFTNGSRGAMVWLPEEAEALLHRLVGIEDVEVGELPQHPEVWRRLCGRYRLPPVGDLRGRALMGGGVEVRVRGDRLIARIITPIPALYRGFPLLPEDDDDACVFRLDLSTLGMAPVRLAFARDEEGFGVIHTDLGGQPISLYESRSSSTRRSRADFGAGAAARLGSVVESMGKRKTTSSRARGSQEIDRLTDLDRVMLGASKKWPQDIAALAILDGSPLLDEDGHLRMEAIRMAIEERLHRVPRLRQIIYTPSDGLGGPLWVDDRGFDLADHLKERRVEPPGGERELADVVERLRSQPLDLSRPMWDMCFLTGLPADRVGLYVRLHHTIADGMAAMTSLAALLDTGPDQETTSARMWVPETAPSDEDLRTDRFTRRSAELNSWTTRLAHPWSTVRELRRAWPAVRELLAERPATKTSLDRIVGASRDLALVRSTVDEVKRVAHQHGASVNDVLLTAIGGGLRALLDSRGELAVDTTLRIYVPMSLRRGASVPQQGNLIAQMVVRLPLEEPDPIRRLRGISAETKGRKAKPRTSLGVLMHGRFVRRLALVLVMRQRVNATSACIPGPTTPLYLAGARLLEVFPLLPLIANEPLGVGALSYAGGFCIGVVVDGETVPDLHVFAQGLRADLDVLLSAEMSSCDSARRMTGHERTKR